MIWLAAKQRSCIRCIVTLANVLPCNHVCLEIAANPS